MRQAKAAFWADSKELMRLRVLQCSFLANLFQAGCPGFSLRDLGGSRKRSPLPLPQGYQRDCGQLKPTSGKGKDIFFSAESFIKLYDLEKSIHQVPRLSNKTETLQLISQGCSQITRDPRCGRPGTEGSTAGSLPSCFPVFSNSFPFALRTDAHIHVQLHTRAFLHLLLQTLFPSFCHHPVLRFSSLPVFLMR